MKPITWIEARELCIQASLAADARRAKEAEEEAKRNACGECAELRDALANIIACWDAPKGSYELRMKPHIDAARAVLGGGS